MKVQIAGIRIIPRGWDKIEGKDKIKGKDRNKDKDRNKGKVERKVKDKSTSMERG
jgi:hypothetical protein